MRKNLSFLSLCVVIGLFCWGCNGFQPQKAGILSIKMNIDPAFSHAATPGSGLTETRKAMTPEADWAPSTFTITGEGPGGATFSIESVSKNSEARLVPGEWRISAKGYAPGGTEVVAGEASCTLQPGRTTAVSLVLRPLAGIGDLQIAITTNFAPAAGARLAGELVYRGLPGGASLEEGSTRLIDMSAEEAAVAFTGIEAGHYSLSLRLLDADGIVSGGAADSVIVVAGFTTSGTCPIELGTPTAEVSATLFPVTPLPPPLLSVSHRFPASRCPVPLALSRAASERGERIDAQWFLNGAAMGAPIAITAHGGILPEGILAFPQCSDSPEVSLIRADLVEASTTSLRTGSARTSLIAVDAGGDAEVGWRASYAWDAAIGDCLHEMGVNGTGKGAAYKARTVAASPSGLVAISGLDEDCALHVFAAGYGASLQNAAPSGVSVLPLDTSWIRLWRDKIKIDGSFKSADKLAVSRDGRLIAAASTASTWVAVYELDERGALRASHSLKPSDAGMAGFGNVKGLCFSPDSTRLYAASNKDGTAYAFNVGSGDFSLRTSCALWNRLSDSESFDLQDLQVTDTGAIVVTSSERSRLAILEDGASLSLLSLLQGTSSGTEPYHPSAIAIPPDGDAFLVLCGGNRVLRYDRDESGYALTSTFTLSPEARDAKYLAAGAGWAGSRPMFAVAGGGVLAIYEPRQGGESAVAHVCLPEADASTGISVPSGLCFARGAFFLSSEEAACVSVFGGEP